ncbi:helix-turn-helix domain-containing protein [Mangrovimonas aestuarii]|uniref:helix-turn-helix domain-containing protein n=1 Tax=Mangrovimonas aestuarii TaxID=3018443 RepID=UPI00237875A0|nr:XRE family transcriptional regulator [Mangrovimonas aestuarii]
MTENNYLIIWIGAKIRELRQYKNWKLADLAELSDVSSAMLSKIENGRVFPTFPTLLKILKTLEVDLNDFFEGVKSTQAFPGYMVVRKEDYCETEKEESKGFQYKNVLSHNLRDVSLEVSILTLSTDSHREMVTTEGYEFIYMLQGDISFGLDDKLLELRQGDSLFFDGRIPHVPYSKSDKEAVILVIYLIAHS